MNTFLHYIKLFVIVSAICLYCLQSANANNPISNQNTISMKSEINYHFKLISLQNTSLDFFQEHYVVLHEKVKTMEEKQALPKPKHAYSKLQLFRVRF